MKLRFYIILMIFLCVGLIFPNTIFASTITVTTATDELNIDGDCSLREAISSANNNIAIDACTAGQQGLLGNVDTIILTTNTFTITLAEGANTDDNTGGDFDIFDSLILSGAGSGATIINGNNLHRVFDVHIPSYNNSVITFQNLQITGGYTSKYDHSTNGGTSAANINDGGGGVRCGRGGTHYDASSPLGDDFFQTCNFANVNIINNTSAGLGGGVLCGGRSDQDYPIDYNGKSGGITCNFDKVSFVGNHNNNAASILDLSLQNGAGLACSGDTEFTPQAQCNLENVTFSGNGSYTLPTNLTLKGGAIACVSSDVNIKYSTLFQNEAITAGAIGVINNVANSGNPIIDYSTCPIMIQGSVIENLSSAVPPASYDNCEPGTNVTSGNHNLESINTCNLLGANDLTNTTSGLVGPAIVNYPSSLYTLFPQTGTAIVDSGGSLCPLCTPARSLTLDARSSTRPLDGNGDASVLYDIGAVEASYTDVELGGSVSPATAILGTDSVLYTINATNIGTQTAYGVQIVANLPAIFDTVPPPIIIPPGGGFCIYSAPTITCEIASLASSATSSFTVLAIPNSTGPVSTTFSLSPLAYLESNTSNDTLILSNSVANVTSTPTTTPTSTPSPSPSDTPSITPTSTAGPSSTPTNSPTPSATPTITTTPPPSNTPGPSMTPSRTPTQTPQANIGIESFTDSPDPVFVKGLVTFTFVIKNYGNTTANNVITVLDLTPIMAYGQKISSLPTNCVTNGNKRNSVKVIECAWGALSAQSTLAWSIAVESWPVAGSFNTGLQIYQNETDPNKSNNTSLITTSVRCQSNNVTNGPCSTPTPIPTVFVNTPSPRPPSNTPPPSPTPTPSVVPTLASSSGWWIVENASLHINDVNTTNSFPLARTNCPGSTEYFFSCGKSGLLTSQNGSIFEIFGKTKAPPLSASNWTLENYPLKDTFRSENISSFFNYLKDKNVGKSKTYPNIENFLVNSKPDPNLVHFVASNQNTLRGNISFANKLAVMVNGDLSLEDNPNPDNNKTLLLIVNGELTISEKIANTRSNAINAIIIAKKINLAGVHNTLKPNPLLINGGYFSYEPSAGAPYRLSEVSSQNTYPIDIIYNPKALIDYLDILSTSPTVDL